MPYRYDTDTRILSLETLESINDTLFVCSSDSSPRKVLGSLLLSLASGNANNIVVQTIDIEEFVMAYQNAFDGFNRFTIEYDTNSQITVKQGSYGIGSAGVFYEISSDQTVSLDDDLDEGSKAADKAYNLFIGLDNEESVFFAFTLSNSPPSNMFNGLLVGFVCTDSSSLIRKFKQNEGELAIDWPQTTAAHTINTPASKDISHLVPSGFMADIAFWVPGSQFVMSYTDGSDTFGEHHHYIAGHCRFQGGTIQFQMAHTGSVYVEPMSVTLWT